MSDDTSPAPEETVEEEPVERDEAREQLLASFTDALGDAVVESHIVAGKDLWIRVSTEAWRTAADVARNRLGARYFCFLSGIDWMPSPYGRSMDSEVDLQVAGPRETPEAAAIEQGYGGGATRFQVFARVAHVGQPGRYWGVTLKADVPDDPFSVDSWTSIYAGADWHERETWEMFGFGFLGHPGLRNMYLPTGFEGHPLRKDFPLVSRQVKPWPGIVDVEQFPDDDSESGADAGAEAGAAQAADEEGSAS
jgi:NADH-quinone oxidoreductase subunit C